MSPIEAAPRPKQSAAKTSTGQSSRPSPAASSRMIHATPFEREYNPPTTNAGLIAPSPRLNSLSQLTGSNPSTVIQLGPLGVCE